MLAGLTSTFVSTIQEDDRISDEVADQVSVAVESGVDFVSSDQVEAAATAGRARRGDDARRSSTTTSRPSSTSLKAGLLAAALIALASLAFTRDLPRGAPAAEGEADDTASTVETDAPAAA